MKGSADALVRHGIEMIADEGVRTPMGRMRIAIQHDSQPLVIGVPGKVVNVVVWSADALVRLGI